MDFSSGVMNVNGDDDVGASGMTGERRGGFILVEYPGVVKNIDKALNTLGGISAVTQAAITSGQLELRYQPENAYQSALVADKKVVDEVFSGKIRLVVRIRRRRKAKLRPDDQELVRDAKGSIDEVKCLGLVSMVFTFKSMCDFHYLPLRKAQEGCGNRYEDLVPRLIPTTFLSAMSWFESSGAESFNSKSGPTPHFLPPPVFSRYLTPSTKIMCNNNEAERHASISSALDGENGLPSSSTSNDSLTAISQRKNTGGHGKNLRSERKSHTVTVMGQDLFPNAPTENALRDVECRVKLERPHELIQQLFVERPLWTRAALLQRSDLDENVLKVILAKYAFYIASGPWGRCWCKFGYDPRTDPNAKQFQTIMVSFRDHKNIPERQRLKLSIGGVTATPNCVGSREFNQVIDFIYRPGILPPVRQMWYCVCDVHLPVAQKVLRKDFFAVLKECHETHGWLPPEIISSIRAAIKQDVERVSRLLEPTEDYSSGLPLPSSAIDTPLNGSGHDVYGRPLTIDSSRQAADNSSAPYDEEMSAYEDEEDGTSMMDW